jgi:acylphosphatase
MCADAARDVVVWGLRHRPLRALLGLRDDSHCENGCEQTNDAKRRTTISRTVLELLFLHEQLDARNGFRCRLNLAPHKKCTPIPLTDPNRTERRVSATIRKFVSDTAQARRYFISGMVQGVGYRFFAQHAAEKLRLSGFVRNLRDGRVEVYAVGDPERLAEMRSALERGPRFSSVTDVREETAQLDSRYTKDFIITYDD